MNEKINLEGNDKETEDKEYLELIKKMEFEMNDRKEYNLRKNANTRTKNNLFNEK